MSNQDDKNAVKGELLAHGADNYLHDPNKSMNYYAQIRTDNGTVEKWGKDLESVVKESGVQVGDTVVLAELGKEPVVVGDKTFNKTLWNLQKYEPAVELPNTIEHDEKELSKSISDTDKTKENEENAPNQPKKTPNLSDFEFELPSNIKNNYIAIIKNRHLSDQKINYYDKDDKDQVNIAFEDRNKSLHTSRQDEKTIYAMLDMAQSKGWSDIKLKGTEEFKQKAWLEASLRGIGVKGYEPNEKDLAELQAKQQARTTNQVEMIAQKAPETKQEERFNERLENPANNQAYLDKIGADFEGARVEHISNSFDKTREFANAFVSKGSEQKELVNFHNGYKAIISGNNLDKMLSNKAHQKSDGLHLHLTAVANADKLFENAVFGWEHKDKDEKSGNQIHRAIAPLKIEDQIYLAKLTIKELAREQGSRFYSLEAVEIEESKSPIPEMMRKNLDKQELSQHRHNGALIDIIVQNAQEYNRQNQKNVENLQNNNKNINYKEIAKDTAIEAGAIAVTPAPLQPVIAGAFLAKDAVSAGEFLQEKVDTKLKSDKELTKELKKEVTQIFQNGYKDGTVTNLDGLIRELKERGYEVKENDKSIRVTDKNGTAITVKNEPFTKVFDAVKSLKDELKPETIKANYPNIDDVNIANITAYKNYLLEQFKTPQALEKSLSELNRGVKDLANGKSINFPTLPPNEERPVIDVRVPESGEKSRIK